MSEFKRFSHRVAKDPIPATIQTLTHRIQGLVYVRRGLRLLDSLRDEEEFIAVTNATIFDARQREIARGTFMAVNKQHIVWILPHDEEAPDGEEGRAYE